VSVYSNKLYNGEVEGVEQALRYHVNALLHEVRVFRSPMFGVAPSERDLELANELEQEANKTRQLLDELSQAKTKVVNELASQWRQSESQKVRELADIILREAWSELAI
jgi:hypothetical protein